MARHGFVGFLSDEQHLRGVDQDFRELARQLYFPKGAGTFGVSCAGHFYPTMGEEIGPARFWPLPYGHLGIAFLPQLEHIPELIDLIYAHTQKDADSWLDVLDKPRVPDEIIRYHPSLRLEEIASWKTSSGLYSVVLQVRLGDRGIMDQVEDYLCSPIPITGNEKVFEEARKRCEDIQVFWKSLEMKVADYNRRHGFLEPDFEKEEFT